MNHTVFDCSSSIGDHLGLVCVFAQILEGSSFLQSGLFSFTVRDSSFFCVFDNLGHCLDQVVSSLVLFNAFVCVLLGAWSSRFGIVKTQASLAENMTIYSMDTDANRHSNSMCALPGWRRVAKSHSPSRKTRPHHRGTRGATKRCVWEARLWRSLIQRTQLCRDSGTAGKAAVSCAVECTIR